MDFDYALISGPLVSYGQGATRCPSGFNGLPTLRKNIAALSSCTKQILVFSWSSNDYLSKRYLEQLHSLESSQVKVYILSPPLLKDFGNRFKQMYSISYLLSSIVDAKPTDRIIRLRIDIEYTLELINYLTQQPLDDTLIVSEIQPSYMYLGDFLHCGSFFHFSRFVSKCCLWKSYWIHPSNVHDYTIKQTCPFNSATRLMSKTFFGRFFLILLHPFLGSQQSISYVAVPPQLLGKCLWRSIPFNYALPQLFTGNVLLDRPKKLSTTIYYAYIYDFMVVYFQLVIYPGIQAFVKFSFLLK